MNYKQLFFIILLAMTITSTSLLSIPYNKKGTYVQPRFFWEHHFQRKIGKKLVLVIPENVELWLFENKNSAQFHLSKLKSLPPNKLKLVKLLREPILHTGQARSFRKILLGSIKNNIGNEKNFILLYKTYNKQGTNDTRNWTHSSLFGKKKQIYGIVNIVLHKKKYLEIELQSKISSFPYHRGWINDIIIY